MALLVQKFGGSSLATPEQIKAVAARLKLSHEQGHDVIAVVSAMGKTTDQLVALAGQISTTPNRRELDMLLTTGERISMALLSMALHDLQVPAISFTGSQAGVLTDSAHSNALIADIKPQRVLEELNKGRLVVLAGFQGVDPRTREITTLGRGGSDTTAVAMAAHFKAERCEILKDVDGVYSADPRLVANPRHWPELSYDQMLEITFWGAKVLHYRCVELASRLHIPVAIAFAHGQGRHTVIKKDVPMFEAAQIVSINSHENVFVIELAEPNLSRALDQLQTFLQNHQMPWPQILSSDANDHASRIYVTAPIETLRSLENINDIRIATTDLSSVTATCYGSTANEKAREMLNLLANEKIEVLRTQMSSLSFTIYVKQSDRIRTIQTLHQLIQPS